MSESKQKGKPAGLIGYLLSKLPWATKPAPEPEPVPPPAPVVEHPRAPRLGRKILIVDDDPVILKILSCKLDSTGYDVETADDPSCALGVVRSGKPDLILLDLVFPPDVAYGGSVSWDGFRVMNWLRSLGEGKSIPIIVISSEESSQFQSRALANGAMAFFSKPVDLDRLVSVIRETLSKESGSAELASNAGARA